MVQTTTAGPGYHSHHDDDHHDCVHDHDDDHGHNLVHDDDDDDDDDSCLNALMAPAECLIVSCSNEVSTLVSAPPLVGE